jgi:hypothetical protein
MDLAASLLHPSITDWMSAIGGLGTLFVAAVAYLHWRRPDDTKRRADTADEIIRLSAEFEAAFLDARSPIIAFDIQSPTARATDADLLDLIVGNAANQNSAKIAEARRLGLSLYSLRTQARGILSTIIADDLIKFFNMFEEFETASTTAKYFAPLKPKDLTPANREKMKRNMFVLGWRYGDPNNKANSDSYENEVKTMGDMLRRQLVPYLITDPNNV